MVRKNNPAPPAQDPKQGRAALSNEARIEGLRAALANFRICALTCLAATGTAIGLMLGTNDEALLRDASASLANYGLSVRLGVAYQLLPVILIVLLVYWVSIIHRLYR